MHEHHDALRDALQADLGPLASLPDVFETGRLHRFSHLSDLHAVAQFARQAGAA